MFFSKRAFNALNSSSRCPDDKAFLLRLMFRAFVALMIAVSRVSYLLSCCALPRIFYGLSLRSYPLAVPRRVERTRQYVLARRRKADMCVSHLSPAARNRQKNFWRFLYKCCLLLQRKHQISVAGCLRGQRSKLPAADTKSRQSCMRVLFHSFQAQCDPAKIRCGHFGGSNMQGVSEHHRRGDV